jgi:acetyl esterase
MIRRPLALVQAITLLSLPLGALQTGTKETHAEEFAFKSTPQGDLKIHVFFPDGWKSSDQRPVILLFFGGGFISGSPDQLFSKARYFAARGIVAAAPEYRIQSKHQTLPDKSIEDAASAVRWVRKSAQRLGIDPNRLIAAGASAGGTAAAVIAVTDEFDGAVTDKSISARPNALVLLNPATGTVRIPEGMQKPREEIVQSWARMYAHFENPQKGNPPTIVFFGTQDSLLGPGRAYVRKSLAAGNRVELYTAEGQGHGFFNDTHSTGPDGKLGRPGWHEAVLRKTDEFLGSLGYLKGKPSIRPLDSDHAVLTREP